LQMFKSAAILAGGKSTRMGFDKQLLEAGGRTVVEQLIVQLKARFADVLVTSPTPQLYAASQVGVIQDVYRDSGPLAGIHAALLHAQSRWVFITACDMPYLELPYIDFMIQRLHGADYGACVTEVHGRLQPFHAFYSRDALPLLDTHLQRGHCSVTRFLREIKALVIPEEEAAPLVPGWRAFLNLNTPQEYARFRGETHGSG